MGKEDKLFIAFVAAIAAGVAAFAIAARAGSKAYKALCDATIESSDFAS